MYYALQFITRSSDFYYSRHSSLMTLLSLPHALQSSVIIVDERIVTICLAALTVTQYCRETDTEETNE